MGYGRLGFSIALWLMAGAASAANMQATPDPQEAGATTPAVDDTAKPPILVPSGAETKQYNPATGFPEHNGALSGMLIVIPQSEVGEFNKPAGSERHLDRVARAEAGAVLAIKLVFVGIQPDWEGHVDINYDLSITAPDGKTYGEEYRSLSGVKGKVVSAEGVFDNRNKIVLMQFEGQDTPGVYTIKAVVHDRVAGLDLPLQTQVELIEKAPAIPGINVPDTTPPVTAAPATDGNMAPIPDPEVKAKPVRKGKKKYRRRRH